MKKIMFTGGGSGGHVTLNLNLIPIFQKNGWQIVYVGSETGIEKELISKTKDKNGRSFNIRTTKKFQEYFKLKGDIKALVKRLDATQDLKNL